MAKKQVSKVSDKLTKVNDSFNVQMYDNGFMLEVGGKDSDGEWKNAKIMCNDIDQLIALIKEVTAMERDE